MHSGAIDCTLTLWVGLCDIMETLEGSRQSLLLGLDVLVPEQASSCAPSLELSAAWIIFLDYYTKGQQAEEEMAARVLQ